jgi:hypothetical protein
MLAFSRKERYRALRSDTHFEQIPLETIKALVQEEPHDEEKAEHLQATKGKGSPKPSQTKG